MHRRSFLIGGGIAEAGQDLFGPLNTVLDEFEWRPAGARVRVFKAALGPRAGAAVWNRKRSERQGQGVFIIPPLAPGAPRRL